MAENNNDQGGRLPKAPHPDLRRREMADYWSRR